MGVTMVVQLMTSHMIHDLRPEWGFTFGQKCRSRIPDIGPVRLDTMWVGAKLRAMNVASSPRPATWSSVNSYRLGIHSASPIDRITMKRTAVNTCVMSMMNGDSADTSVPNSIIVYGLSFIVKAAKKRVKTVTLGGNGGETNGWESWVEEGTNGKR